MWSNNFLIIIMIILVYFYIIVILSLMIIVCIKWVQKRNFFPLKERSPKTLILFCISNTMYILAFPITYLLLIYWDVTVWYIAYIFFFARILSFWPYVIR